MIAIYYQNKKFKNQIEYAFKTIFFSLDLNYSFIDKIVKDSERIFINYSSKVINEKNVINIIPSQMLFNNNYLKEYKEPNIKKVINNGNDYVSIFSENDIYFKEDECFTTNFDIVSDTFFMLTRYHEYMKDDIKSDVHMRYLFRESLSYKHNFIERPIVNEYIQFMMDIINTSTHLDIGYKNKNSELHLSHDVDSLLKYPKHSFKDFVRFLYHSLKLLAKKDFNIFFDKSKNFLYSIEKYEKDEYWTFKYLLDIEKKYNFKTTYYFMTSGETEYDNEYSISDNKVVKLIHEILKHKHEVSLHGSYNSYREYNLMKNEIDKLPNDSNSIGIRQHYLRFDVAKTWDIQNNLGLLYDSTLGYADMIGFRAGICYPFKVFSLEKNKELDLYEIPLIVMDGTLKQYMNLGPNEAYERVLKLINEVKKYNGVFSLLWHNSSLDSEWNDYRCVYEKLLKKLSEENFEGLTGIEIIDRYSKM